MELKSEETITKTYTIEENELLERLGIESKEEDDISLIVTHLDSRTGKISLHIDVTSRKAI